MRFISILTCVLFLSGCVSTFPENLQVPSETNLLSFKAVLESPQAKDDSLARWGGVIAEIKNLDSKTMLEIVYFDLRGYGRPLVKDESAGRFRVYVDKFLDPVVYRKGRSITVLGKLTDVEAGMIGEYEYKFPTITDAEVHLWKEVKEVQIDYIDPWPFWHYYPGQFYGPRYYGPVRTRTIRQSGSSGGSKNDSRKIN